MINRFVILYNAGFYSDLIHTNNKFLQSVI